MEVLSRRSDHRFLYWRFEFITLGISHLNPLQKFLIKKATIQTSFRRGENLQNIAFHLKHSLFNLPMDWLILHMEKLSFKFVEIILFPNIKLQTVLLKKSTLSQTIKRRGWSHNNYIFSTEERSHRRKPIHLNFIVDRCLFFNIGSRTR